MRKFKALLVLGAVAAIFALNPEAHTATQLAHACVDEDAATKGTGPGQVRCARRAWLAPLPGSFVLSCITATAPACRWGNEDARFRKFVELPDEALVNVCLNEISPAEFTNADPCSATEVGKAWVSKASVPVGEATPPAPSSTRRITVRWSPPGTTTENEPITEGLTYVVRWWAPEPFVAQEITTLSPPLVLTTPNERICMILFSKLGERLSDPTAEKCVAVPVREPPKPNPPGNVTIEVTVEFSEAPTP